ncbi:MAG: ECF-type sigma factor [Pirellula sp.]
MTRPNQVTEVLQAMERGESGAVNELWNVVYDELKQLAAHKLVHERASNSIQATALVNEVYIRLLGSEGSEVPTWKSRAHFFGAASEAMRRILVDAARRRGAQKRGDGMAHAEYIDSPIDGGICDEEIIAVNDVLDHFATIDPLAAKLVKLRFFAGLTTSEAAEVLDMPVRSAHEVWSYARAWLRRELRSG